MAVRGMTYRGVGPAPVLARIAAVAGFCIAAGAWADLPTEELSVIPAVTAKNRAYVSDIAISHIGDGKLHVIDTDSGNYLGVIGSGFAGQVTYSPDGSDILLATGYLHAASAASARTSSKSGTRTPSPSNTKSRSCPSGPWR